MVENRRRSEILISTTGNKEQTCCRAFWKTATCSVSERVKRAAESIDRVRKHDLGEPLQVSEAEKKVSFNLYPFLIPVQKVGNSPSATIFIREF